MIKLKEKFEGILNIFKGLFNNFPITLITILITTIICAIFIDEDILSNIMQFAFIFLCGTILIETKNKNLSKKRIIEYVIAAIIAFLLTYFSNAKIQFLSENVDNIQFLNIITRIIACYCSTTIILAIYFNYKKSSMSFEKYVTNVATYIFKSGIIYVLLSIGVAIITEVFIFLFLKEDYDLILRIEILILGIYYMPQIIYSLYNPKDEIGKFMKILVKYVLDILLIIAFAIIYIYLAKVIILRDIPSNQIFRIIAALFIIGCPSWTMASNFNEETMLDKINKKLPILFIPFIFLQAYSIGIRIISNGITEARYLGVVLMILEIVYIVMYIRNKDKIGNVLIFIIILILISGIVPYINMFNISKLSQYNNLKIYKEKTELTDEEKEKILGAYYYLKETDGGDKLIDKLLSNDDKDEIISFNKQSRNDMRYIYASINKIPINIEGYKSLYTCSGGEYIREDDFEGIAENELENVKLYLEENDKEIVLNLKELFDEYMKHEKDIDEYIKKHNEFLIDANTKFVIKDIYIRYENVYETIYDYSINGYLLEK